MCRNPDAKVASRLHGLGWNAVEGLSSVPSRYAANFISRDDSRSTDEAHVLHPQLRMWLQTLSSLCKPGWYDVADCLVDDAFKLTQAVTQQMYLHEGCLSRFLFLDHDRGAPLQDVSSSMRTSLKNFVSHPAKFQFRDRNSANCASSGPAASSVFLRFREDLVSSVIG